VLALRKSVGGKTGSHNATVKAQEGGDTAKCIRIIGKQKSNLAAPEKA
jgi:hypothetical protein